MAYQRTQIYLDPDEHRRLVAEARERGLSLAALLRDIVSEHVSERAAPYETRSFDPIVGVAGRDRPGDDAAHVREAMDEVLEAREQKKMGRREAGTRGRKR
jgi:hypothetical protein